MTSDKETPSYRPQDSAPQRFYLNKRDGKVLGVCAGLADYAGFDVTLIRVGLVLATVFSGGMTLPIYLAAGLLAPAAPRHEARAPEPPGPRQAEDDSPGRAYGGRVDRQPPSHTRFYRNKADGKVMGVCAGIADYTGLDVTLVRVCFIAGVFISGGALLPAYFLAGLISPEKPKGWEAEDEAQKQFWQRVRASPARAARDLRSRLRDIDRRLADIETYVTSENRSLAREIEQLR